MSLTVQSVCTQPLLDKVELNVENSDLNRNDYHSLPISELHKILNTNPEKGLSSSHAQKMLIQHAENTLSQEVIDNSSKGPLIWSLISGVLIILGISLTIIYAQNSRTVFLILGLFGLIGGVVSGYASYNGNLRTSKYQRAADSYDFAMSYTVKVIRDGKIITIQPYKLVPGDICLLQKGDKISADMRLFEVQNLIVEYTNLFRVSKMATKGLGYTPGIKQPINYENIVHAGCAIAEGNGKAVVVQTGKDTLYAKQLLGQI